MALARCHLVVTDRAGNIIDGASITVQRESVGFPLVAVYSDRDGATPLGNPFIAADGADAGFHVAGGAYMITAANGGFTRVWRYVPVGLAQESDAFATAAPFDALAFNGAEVNGNVYISQEFGTTGATLANNTAKYTADCWEGFYNHGAATAVVTSGQIAAASFGAALPGYTTAHRIKATTAISSIANGDFARHRQKIEGFRTSRFGLGSSAAFSIAIFARWYVTAPGVAFVRLSNSAANRAYHREVTLVAGWNTIREVIPGDTSGAWDTTTPSGLVVEFFCAGKAASPATPNAWGSTLAVQTTNSINLLGSNNNESVITGLKVLPVVSSAELISSERALLLARSGDTELALCRRYWEASYNSGTSPGTQTTTAMFDMRHRLTVSSIVFTSEFVCFSTPKRVAPTMTLYSPDHTNTTGVSLNGTATPVSGATSGERAFNWFINPLSASVSEYYRWHYVADSRM